MILMLWFLVILLIFFLIFWVDVDRMVCVVLNFLEVLSCFWDKLIIIILVGE